MHFVHQPYQKGETIAAVATAPGEGGIAVIRISGDLAIKIAARIYLGPVETYPSHTVHFGKIVDEGGVVDDVLLVVMRAPRSYTGEETVEIHCHGGSLVTRRVLETALKAGARAALPGEFTFKAFMNGKIDLAQAEAVQQLIAAKNELALAAAQNHLQGALSRKILQFQRDLVETAAILEAWVDFPEEGLEFATTEEVVAQLKSTCSEMENLSATFHDGKIAHEGLSLCLAGAPNVGKSSLMNALLGKERAIVTDIPGTTRDTLEEEMRFSGLHFKLIDTAGIRQTDEIVEREGIRRSQEAMRRADLILLVLDATKGVTASEKELMQEAPEGKTVLVWNKIDAPSEHAPPQGAVTVSARERIGLEELRRVINQKVWRCGPPAKDEIVITTLRHKQALDRAIESLVCLIRGLENGISAEFCAFDMRQMLRELGTVIGTDITEDVLSAIFSKFCVGK